MSDQKRVDYKYGADYEGPTIKGRLYGADYKGPYKGPTI